MQVNDDRFPLAGLIAWIFGALFVGVGVVVLFNCWGCSEESLACVDHQACLVDGAGKVRLLSGEKLEGECLAGVLDCATGRCVGSIGPQEELCNGLDDDCNGSVDDAPFSFTDPCSAPGACGPCAEEGSFRCLAGRVVCVTKSPLAEACNGLDDDCDCEVDEIPMEFSYSGPPETAGIGECSPQVTVCLDGVLRQTPQVLPADEICGDSKDNDCDGLVDESPLGVEQKSVLLVLDYSVSMDADYKRRMVIDSICDVAATGDFLLALVGIGFSDPAVRFLFEFDLAPDACVALRSLEAITAPWRGSFEPQPEGVMSGLLQTDWPTDNRVVLVASDEIIQENAYTLDDVADVCVAEGFSLLVVSTASWASDWDPLAAICGGDVVLFGDFDAAEAVASVLSVRCG